MKNKIERRMFTAIEIKTIAKLWDKFDTEQIAEKLGRPKSSITYMAKKIRDLGYMLPAKHKKGVLDALIHETLKDSGLVFKK